MMASLDSVTAAAQAVEAAREALRAEIWEAVDAGIPKAAVARAAGISRATLALWEKDRA